MGLIQRECSEDLLRYVRSHKFFDYMIDDIKNGNILPCLRSRKIDFYKDGARLFRFSLQRVYTHMRYIGEEGKDDRALSENEQALEVYKRILKTASTYRPKPLSELAAVHRLFTELAASRSAHKPGQLAIIDVEARFQKDEAKNLPTTMIDLVFLLPDRRILFMEVKCMGNEDVESSGKAKAEVQVKNYEQHLRHASVLGAMNRSIQTQLKLVGKFAELATGVFPRVPILLLDPSEKKQKVGPRNSWLTDRLGAASVWTIDSQPPLVLDGRGDPVVVIREFVDKFVG